MLDLIASISVRILNRVFHFLPQRFNLFFGRCAGSLIYFVSGKRSRIAYSAMKASFGDRYTPYELRRLVKKVYRSMGETFIEILVLTKVDKKYIDKYVTKEGLDRLAEGSSNSGGMILASAHFGNWEMSTVVSRMVGYPLHILARDQKMKRLNELLNRLREEKGNIVIRKGRDIKRIFRALRNGATVGILADQNAGANGLIMPFFGRPASIAVGAFRFAQKTGAAIVPAFMHRLSGPYHKVEFHEPMRIAPGENIRPYMETYNRLLESEIEKNPDQWLWMHKKWKASPLKKILILDDGRKGHFKQSLTVAELLKKHWIDRGHSTQDVEIATIPVRYKSPFWKSFLRFWSFGFTKRCQGRLRILKLSLEESSYKDLTREYADIILSTGSAMQAVNKIMKIENNCHNATVMAPSRSMRKWFDLVISPRHDDGRAPGVYKNTVVTELAPNMISPQRLRSLLAQDKPDEKGIGLLMGGDNRSFRFSEEFVSSLADSMELLMSGGYRLRATTSRRSGPRAEDILSARLSENENCLRMIRGSMDSREDTVDKILAQSSVIVVSAESISMVSEAVSSSRKVIAFFPNGVNWRKTKYGKFVERLHRDGYLRIASSAEDIPELVRRASAQSPSVEPPEDDRLILSVARKLF